MSKFKIGDRVKAIKNVEGVDFTDKFGKVIAVESKRIGIEFEEYFSLGHDCDGKGKSGHCRWTDNPSEVKLVTNYKSKAPTHVVIWEEDSDPARLFTSEEDAKKHIKDLSDNPNVKQDSILFIEIKSCKKVGVTKSLRYNQHKI